MMTKIRAYGGFLYGAFIVAVAGLAVHPLWVFAGEDTKTIAPPCPAGQLCNPIKYPNIIAFLLAILDVAVQYGALLIVFFIVFAGFKFVTAQGNTEKISDARKMLTWIVVGAFVLLGVYVIRAAICGTINQLAGNQNLKCSEQFTPRIIVD